nr:RNase H family protein [uncultured Desulfobulbus sp.]
MKPFVFTLRVETIDAHTLGCRLWHGSEGNSLLYGRFDGAVSFARENSIARAINNNRHQLAKILKSAIDGKLRVGQTINCVFLENFPFLQNEHFYDYIRLDRRHGGLAITTSETGFPEGSKIFADGSCNHESNQSGYGGFVETAEGTRKLFFQPFSGGSSNLMELLAVVEGLKRVGAEEAIQINTDSRFVIRGLVQWVHFWRHNTWQTAYGRDVRYAPHWQRAYNLCEGKYLEFKWIKGHSGNLEQNVCHLLAKAAAAQAAPGRPLD